GAGARRDRLLGPDGRGAGAGVNVSSVQLETPVLGRSLFSSRLIWILGLGAFGLAFSITTLTFLPVELGRFTGSGTLIALVLGAGAVPRRGARDDAGVRRRGSLRAGGRRPRTRVQGFSRVPQDELVHRAGGGERAQLPDRERRLGGDVRRGADLRRPLHHEGP